MKEHREIQTLIDQLERHITYQGKEVDRLREINAELLEALEYHQEQTRPIQRTIDLLAKHKEQA